MHRKTTLESSHQDTHDTEFYGNILPAWLNALIRNQSHSIRMMANLWQLSCNLWFSDSAFALYNSRRMGSQSFVGEDEISAILCNKKRSEIASDAVWFFMAASISVAAVEQEEFSIKQIFCETAGNLKWICVEGRKLKRSNWSEMNWGEKCHNLYVNYRRDKEVVC